ncbi:MAG: hypothetical protein RJA02_740, partial [Armatimonadota bacterium]
MNLPKVQSLIATIFLIASVAFGQTALAQTEQPGSDKPSVATPGESLPKGIPDVQVMVGPGARGYTVAFVFPKKNRRGCVRVDNMLYLSGHGLDLPLLEGVRQTGRFGENITEAEGYATARAVMLTILATVKAEVGSLDRVKQIVRIFGMCNASPQFTAMPQVIDG